MANVEDSWDDFKEKLRKVGEHTSENSGYDTALVELSKSARRLILYDDELNSDIKLVHYTTWESALNMFKQKGKDSAPGKDPVLRMYSYEQSNDLNEGKIIPPEWKKIEQDASWIKEYLGKDKDWKEELEYEKGKVIYGRGVAYGCSFSSGRDDVEDDLTYWRLYGNDGEGCSLKITLPDRRWAHNPMYKVRYRDTDFNNRKEDEMDEDKKIAECLRELFTAGKEVVGGIHEMNRNTVGKSIAKVLSQVICEYYHLVKHVAYVDEKEYRMVKAMPEANEIEYEMLRNLVKRHVEGPTLETLLSSNSTITIGPTVPNCHAARAYLESLVRGHNIEHVRVKNSSKTYRRT